MAYKQRLKQRYRTKQGVPVGYSHNWYYGGGKWQETKGRGNVWKFRYKSSKSRGGSSKGGPPVGYKVKWKINAYQTATKTSGRRYQTNMYGYKQLVGYYDPKRGKWSKNKRY